MRALKINEIDNVAVVLQETHAGDEVRLEQEEDQKILAIDDIPIYHKIASKDIAQDEPIYKYGEIIGIASSLIHIGEHVHEHNVKSVLKTDN